MRQSLENLVLTLCGAITAVLVASLMFWVEQSFQLSLYSWTFWFILPVGAGLTGFAATSGFWIGSKFLHYRIRSFLWLQTLVVALGSYVLIQFLGYWNARFGEIPLHSVISFGQYLNLEIQASTLTFNLHGHSLGTSGEMGLWGYAHSLLQLVGFALGATMVYFLIVDMPACEACNRYLKVFDKTTRFTADPTAWESLQRALGQFALSQDIGQAQDAHAAFGSSEAAPEAVLRAAFTRYRCPDCQAEHFRLATSNRPKGKKWEEAIEVRVDSAKPVAKEAG